MKSIKSIKQAVAEVGEHLPDLVTNESGAANCAWVATMGQIILREHYGIEAKMVVGDFRLATSASFYDTLAFGEGSGDTKFGGGEFKGHIWLECRGMVIDFSWRYWPALVRAQPNWVWDIEEREYYCGPANTSRNPETLRRGCCRYAPWAEARQSEVVARLLEDMTREGVVDTSKQFAARWAERVAHWAA